MLIKDYYTIESTAKDNEKHLFTVRLNPACIVYEGHFPEKPVSPGVCNIQMIKECSELIIGHQTLLKSIKQCRLTTLITPTDYPMLTIAISITPKDDTYLINASIGKGSETYLDLKAELIDEQ